MTLADRAVCFINNLMLTDEYLGQPRQLRPWQEKIIRDLHRERPGEVDDPKWVLPDAGGK